MWSDELDQLFPSEEEVKNLINQGVLEKRIAKIIAKTIRENYGDIHSAVKVIARKIGANPRAVKNWYEGKNPPNCSNLILLARHMPDIIHIFLKLAGRKDIWNAYEKQIGVVENNNSEQKNND